MRVVQEKLRWQLDINISLSENRVIISTSGLQSNLSIANITQTDYALYKIVVVNDIERFDHIFSLTTAGKYTFNRFVIYRVQ